MKCSKCNVVRLIGDFKGLGLCAGCSNTTQPTASKSSLSVSNNVVGGVSFEVRGDLQIATSTPSVDSDMVIDELTEDAFDEAFSTLVANGGGDEQYFTISEPRISPDGMLSIDWEIDGETDDDKAEPLSFSGTWSTDIGTYHRLDETLMEISYELISAHPDFESDVDLTDNTIGSYRFDDGKLVADVEMVFASEF